MMRARRLEQAIEEAERFIRAARLALVMGPARTDNLDERWLVPSRWSATTRRASLDLTRALADLRQS